jgi:hypothetical protein
MLKLRRVLLLLLLLLLLLVVVVHELLLVHLLELQLHRIACHRAPRSE